LPPRRIRANRPEAGNSPTVLFRFFPTGVKMLPKSGDAR
jgi:hypothetical protein